MTRTSETELERAVEVETQRLGRRLGDRRARVEATIFETRWWDEHFLARALDDDSIRIQMLRFADVLPMLRTPESLVRHLREYHEAILSRDPHATPMTPDLASSNEVLDRVFAWNARSNARQMASRFLVGSTLGDVIESIRAFRQEGLASAIQLLANQVVSNVEAERYQRAHIALTSTVLDEISRWPENPITDCDQFGPIPRVHVTLRLSQLHDPFAPLDASSVVRNVKRRLRPVLQAACEADCFLQFDMEHSRDKTATLAILQDLLMEDAFCDFCNVGLTIQAYHRDAGDDLNNLLHWTEARQSPIWIRLVKGAYWHQEASSSQLRHRPSPVHDRLEYSDAHFERHTRFLMEHYQWLRPALATHHLRSLAHGLAWAQQFNVPRAAFELQMIRGIAMEDARTLADMGYRVRILSPVSEAIPGLALLAKQYLDNPSNAVPLHRSILQPSLDAVLEPPHAPPTTLAQSDGAAISSGLSHEDDLMTESFQKEPQADFSQPDIRKAMESAIREVGDELGQEYGAVIAGRVIDTAKTNLSHNPSRKTQVIGRVASADGDLAFEAVQAAREAFPCWSGERPEYRAEYLELIAAELRERRFELAAWEVLECGMPWATADADVVLAIDCCIHFAQEMRRLAHTRSSRIACELNSFVYRPSGVAVVIAPSTSPIGFMAGMTAAALVTGNTVVMKPSSASSVTSARFMEILTRIDLPRGAVNFVPGPGTVVGPELIGSPDVNAIAFAGTQGVAREVNQRAAEDDPRQRMMKRLIAHCGGNNAVLVDDDADLDDAVIGIVRNAFTFAGQDAASCSRVIVARPIADALIPRVVEAAASLTIGPAEDPGTMMGPVINEAAYCRLRDAIDQFRGEHELAYAGDVKALNDDGYFIPPYIFRDIAPTSPLAREEIAGPILSIVVADNWDQAIECANVAGERCSVFSRGPSHVDQARQQLTVSQLAINQTGVGKVKSFDDGLSPPGLAAGAMASAYLTRFMRSVHVSENKTRDGFTAEPPAT